MEDATSVEEFFKFATMPIYSERPDIPGPLRRALVSSDYTDDLEEHFDELPASVRDHHRENHFSVTTLLASPRQRVLYNRHHGKVLLDPTEGMRKLLGHAVHSMLERSPDPGDVVERREGVSLGAHNRPGLLKGLKRHGQPVRSMYIHGKPDVFNPDKGLITDYKTTSVIAMIYGRKMDHEAQLNVLALILRMKGYEIKRLTNEYLFFDWDARDAKKLEAKGYPMEPRKTVEVPIWNGQQVEDFVNLRLRTHLEAEQMKDDIIPHCTMYGPMGINELWMSDPEYKVYKIDFNKKTNEKRQQKTAKFHSASRAECQEWIDDPINFGVEFNIVKFPAKPKRCEWCIIREFCSQYRAMKTTHSEEES